ncbi:MAG: hypothetical protein HYU66_10920 [Armatimonadetes bacterium]|nr:hypothetical protein [Armatimonadota bacterium]
MTCKRATPTPNRPTASHGPPAERYKFIYLSGDQAAGYNVWAALSPDGIHWQRHNAGPVLRVGSDTQTVAFWDERLGRYVAYCRLWNPSRTIGRAESADFFNFPPADEVLAADAQDPPDADLYNSAAMKYPFAENAYLIFTSVYYHPSDNLEVHLAVSRDGIHWRRPERRAFIPNGPPGSFDDGMVYCGTGVLRRGAELWMLYWGSRARHNQHVPALVHSGGVYSRAVLRLDGYVALDASLQPATFVTHPLTFTGTRLEVNAAVRPGGSVRFVLQDEAGQPLPGFGLDECEPVSGDSVRHVVRWKGGADVSARAGKPTKLRAVAVDASLYAFQFARG